MGKNKKKHGDKVKAAKKLAKGASAGAVATKTAKAVKSDTKDSHGGSGVKKVILTATLLAGAYVAAKKLGLFDEDEEFGDLDLKNDSDMP